MALTVEIAGQQVTDPLAVLTHYASTYGTTLRRFDLTGIGNPNQLTLDEVERTRIVASRISRREAEWFLDQAQRAPWSTVDPGLSLADLDPDADLATYRAAEALYRHFRDAAPRGVAMAKISKVLHIKRPALVPILDTRLCRAYRRMAAAAADSYPAVRGTARYLYWLAVRQDVINKDNLVALSQLRRDLAEHGNELVRKMSTLSDVRLLDMLTWSP